jgi:hypothetical protein
VAIGAVAVADMGASPEVVAAVRMLLNDCVSDKWESTAGARYTVPTSWMLYDVMTSLSLFRNAFPRSVSAVWADNVRVVQHSQDQGAVTRRIREHGPKLLLMAGLATVIWMLVWAKVIPSFGLGTLFLIISTLALNVAGNIIFEILRDYRRRTYGRV